MNRPNQRVVYLNGDFVPESEARIPFRDRGVKFGDAVFDTTRTFGHDIFRLREHLERFYRSLRYLRIDPKLTIDEFNEVTERVVERNLPLIGEDDDYWVTQRVTRGIDPADRTAWPEWGGPTVIVECMPLPLAARAESYRDGLEVVTPSVRRVAPDMVSPRAKTHNYLNLVLGDLEVTAQNDKALAILLDENGNLSEGKGSNIFIVTDGAIQTPKERYVLPGVSRAVVRELAEKLGIPYEETDIDLFDAYNAEESFISSTSFCVCPIQTINGNVMPSSVPGPVTQRIIDTYVEYVGFDWYAQYLGKLPA
tara:strand:+ start:340 stop:1266 length:927 start_codon:yes stop_codon:yes gene_type:complete